MADSPLQVIIEIVALLLGNTVSTIFSLLEKLGDLFGSLVGVSDAGGTIGLVISLGIIGLVGYFAAKFLLGSIKTVLLLILAVIAILLLLVFGASVA